MSLKYAVFILRADNDGEGGVFALYSLLHNYREEAAYLPLLLAGLMLGAGFLCGDSIISPAISVLVAVEGLEVATPMFRGTVIPITVVILVLLFAVQHRGTSGVGPIFGPVLRLPSPTWAGEGASVVYTFEQAASAPCKHTISGKRPITKDRKLSMRI